MKQKQLRRFLALALSSAMMLSLAACGSTDEKTPVSSDAAKESSNAVSSQESTQPEDPGKDLSWLNPKELPMVKEGTEKTLKIYAVNTGGLGEPEDSWLYSYITEAMNINLEVMHFSSDNSDEFMAVTFAGGDLPDIIIGGGFETNELVKYGIIEEQIIDIAPYLTEEIMPNLTAHYAEVPSDKNAVMDSEGHVWSLGYLVETGQVYETACLNYDLMEEAGIKEPPTTLEEFLDACRTIKKLYPESNPIGGLYGDAGPMTYLLNAFGYVGYEGTYDDICLRNGEVVLPIADREVYGEVLKLLKTCYDEGLIHKDFFTMGADTAATLSTEGVLYSRGGDMNNIEAYWGAIPLTSDWNDTPIWPDNSNKLTSGGAVICSTCEDPELAAAFLDHFYTYEGFCMIQYGPNLANMSDYLYGTSGWEYRTIDGINKMYIGDIMDEGALYSGSSQYQKARLQIWRRGIGDQVVDYDFLEKNGYVKNEIDASQYTGTYKQDMRKSETGSTESYTYTLVPYLTSEVYPTNVYMDADKLIELGNTLLLLQQYADQETAKFVTGKRSLDELDDYFDEMDAIGAPEYVQAYKEYYEAFKQNQ